MDENAKPSEAELNAQDTVVEVRDLAKVFRIGFFRKRVPALDGVSFSVRRGEIFGLLGPNGAGKTTAIKHILGLLKPSRGQTLLFGENNLTPKLRARLGYLPESPYVYQYLKAPEFLTLCARLSGVEPRDVGEKVQKALLRVGLVGANDRPIRKFSKGMMQRVGIAQALLHDPELLILDEPMSGLDPLGRKDVRDLILEEKARGKTVMFSTHVLSDVEALCDRVVILQKGKVRAYGALADLLRRADPEVEIETAPVPPEKHAMFERWAEAGQITRVFRRGNRDVLVVPIAHGSRVLSELIKQDIVVVSYHELRESLEALFTPEPAPKANEAAPPVLPAS